MRQIMILFLILCIPNLQAQNSTDKLDKVTTIEEAEKFATDSPELTPKIVKLYPEIDSLVPSYFKTVKAGYVFNENGNKFKVIHVNKVKAFRVSYIYLDGNKFTIGEINKLRPKIINQYKQGTPFSVLVKKHSMDSNATGDLNWFTEGMMVPEFENAIKNHKKGAIFTVDVPENKWYYVTLKTYEDKEVSEITLLTIKSSS